MNCVWCLRTNQTAKKKCSKIISFHPKDRFTNIHFKLLFGTIRNNRKAKQFILSYSTVTDKVTGRIPHVVLVATAGSKPLLSCTHTENTSHYYLMARMNNKTIESNHSIRCINIICLKLKFYRSCSSVNQCLMSKKILLMPDVLETLS